MLKLVNLSKSYSDKVIFKDFNLEINDSEFVSIKGQSGSGKTTLINILSMLDSEYSGDYYIDEIDVKLLKNKDFNNTRLKYFSLIFQEYNLISYLTAYENVILPLKLQNISIDDAYISELFSKFNLEKEKNKIVSNLSGGEAQRVSIIRALVTKPKYILADEPTSALDDKNTKIIMDYFKQINYYYKIGIIMVTHSNNLDSYFDKIIRIDDYEQD